MATEIEILPKPRLKIWIICPHCGNKMYTYRKRIKRVICDNCKARLEGSELYNNIYYYKEGRMVRYPWM